MDSGPVVAHTAHMNITLPPHFDAPAFEELIRELSGDWTRDIDASRVRTATPAGAVSLLALGHRHSGLPAGWLRQQLTPPGALLPPSQLANALKAEHLVYVLGGDSVREGLARIGYDDEHRDALIELVATL